jgi:hypothetical protein
VLDNAVADVLGEPTAISEPDVVSIKVNVANDGSHGSNAPGVCLSICFGIGAPSTPLAKRCSGDGSRIDKNRGGALAGDVGCDASGPVAAANENPGLDVLSRCLKAEVGAGEEHSVVVGDGDLGVK